MQPTQIWVRWYQESSRYVAFICRDPVIAIENIDYSVATWRDV